MRIDLYGMTFETPGVTFYLWSPWRASHLEHRLFEAVSKLPGATVEATPDEIRANLAEPKAWRGAVAAVERIMKGWQEEASDSGGERRSWRWLLEADTDAAGYSENGEQANMWGFLRVALDAARPGEDDKGELVDLNGFGLCIWGQHGAKS